MTNKGPTTQLPTSHSLLRAIDFSKDRRLLIGLNIIGLILLFPFGWLFTRIASILRPATLAQGVNIVSFSAIAYLIIIITIIVIFIILHEVVHGIFFWIITGSKPVFGFKGAYAYAAAPGWFIPRNPYLWIGLSPLVVLSLTGFVLITVLPVNWLLPIMIGLIFNAVGSVGDLYVVFWLFLKPATVYIQDQGDAINIYGLP
ncbi:MAG: hypothetical protein B6D39_00255 [Anaerolineae bacterium UTCFX2]|jgi:hypothetical protein|nr:DUF3267 domain-containing protein [Anaerolineales bacterium]OQY95122.1 MAG: hypothetical protein B6D39_00255 [Anaerolineae bacterium UTCFX2]